MEKSDIRKGDAPGGTTGGAQNNFKRYGNNSTKTTRKQILPGTCLTAYLSRYRRELIPFHADPQVARLIDAVNLILSVEGG